MFSNKSATVILIGTCTKDPEVKTFGDKSVTRISMVTEHGWGDKRTSTFWNVDVWGKAGEFVAKDVTKGQDIVVTGEIYERKYESQGVEKKVMQVDARDVSYVRKPKAEGESAPDTASKPAAAATSSSDGWD